MRSAGYAAIHALFLGDSADYEPAEDYETRYRMEGLVRRCNNYAQSDGDLLTFLRKQIILELSRALNVSQGGK